MTASNSVSYFITLVAIALAPGPVALMLVVRSASRDIYGAFGFGVGYSIGGVVIFAIVYLGFGAWLTANPEVFVYTKYLMIAYILWLAFDLWNKGIELEVGSKPVSRSSASVGAGLLTCFISPYMVFLLPLVIPSVLDVWEVKTSQFLFIAVVTFTGLVTGCLLIISFSAQLGRIASSARATLILNRSLATILAMVGAWVGFAS